ncbi:MAG: biotin transporter BioY [Thermoanaerobaculia bacterium]
MNESGIVTLPKVLEDRVIHRSAMMNVMLVVSASVLLALSAQVAVVLPFSPVPMTLQSLAVLLIGAVLGSRRGAAAVILYLVEALSGFPVLAHGGAGLLPFVGPTAGFLYAFPAAAFITGFAAEKGWTRTLAGTTASMLAATAVIHVGGWSWLAAPLHLGAAKAFTIGSLPFLAGDLVKVAIAAAILPSAHRLIRRFA